MKYYLFIFFYIFFLKLGCQNRSQLDSAKALLNSTIADSNKVNIYIYISKDYAKFSNFDSSLAYINKAIKISNENKFYKKQVIAIKYKATIYDQLKGNYRTALGVYKEYYDLCEKIKYKQEMADAIHNIGNMYFYLGNYENALNSYIQSSKINQKLGNQLNIAHDFTNIGAVYIRQKSYSSAIDILKKATKIYTTLNDDIGMSSSYENIGICYYETGELDKALINYFKCVEIEKKRPDAYLAGTYNNIGAVYFRAKNLSKALKSYTLSYEILKTYPDDIGQVYCFQGLGTVYSAIKNFSASQDYLQKSITIAERVGLTHELMESYDALASNYFEMDDFADAYKYLRIQSALKDTISSEGSRNAFAEMQTKFETSEKEAEIKLLKREQEINNLALEKQRVYVLFAIGFVLFLIVIVVLLQKSNQVKKRLNIELERLSIVAKSTENVVLILDTEGKVEWVNDSFEVLSDISIKELIKKETTIFEISNSPRIKEYFNTAIVYKKSIVFESSYKNINNVTIWKQSMLTPTFNINGDLQRLIIIDTDITKQKGDELIIQEKNKDITDSINYAKKIQNAILPLSEKNELPRSRASRYRN
jgi:tetratricopeptide (TPR) repeat protein